MSQFDEIFGPAAGELLGLRGTPITFTDDGGGRSVNANVGPETTRLVETASAREFMRVRNVEYAVADIRTITLQRDTFTIDGEVWTVNTDERGPTLGVAEVVRPIRTETAGRGRLGNRY